MSEEWKVGFYEWEFRNNERRLVCLPNRHCS